MVRESVFLILVGRYSPLLDVPVAQRAGDTTALSQSAIHPSQERIKLEPGEKSVASHFPKVPCLAQNHATTPDLGEAWIVRNIPKRRAECREIGKRRRTQHDAEQSIGLDWSKPLELLMPGQPGHDFFQRWV